MRIDKVVPVEPIRWLAYCVARAALQAVGATAVLLGLFGIAAAGGLLVPVHPAPAPGPVSFLPLVELGGGLAMSMASCTLGSCCIDKAKRMPPVSPLGRHRTRTVSDAAGLLHPADRPPSELAGALLRPASAGPRPRSSDLLLPGMQERRPQRTDHAL
jgi:hypothetical protein